MFPEELLGAAAYIQAAIRSIHDKFVMHYKGSTEVRSVDNMLFRQNVNTFFEGSEFTVDICARKSIVCRPG